MPLVVTIHRFKSEDQAIKIANNTRYGLAEVYGQVIWKRGRGSEFDSYWNDLGEYLVTQRSEGPIRRVKDSGVGGEGGRWSLGFFSEPLNVCLKHD